MSSAAGQEGMGGQEMHLWVPYDLIRSDRPTAETALEQMMGILKIRGQ